jgi:hypothetical protein
MSLTVRNLPTLISLGQSFVLALLPSLDIGCARSGVKGPLTCGSNVVKSISTNYKLKVKIKTLNR